MESYSVKAVLSAKDAGFSKAMETAQKSAGNLKSVITGGLGFGILTGVGHAAFNSISNGISGMVSELNDSSKAWKTYESNMKIFGKADDEIKRVKKELQDYAQTTIYSASDMSNTYAQLVAVGVDSADTLVKGFGGIAAASENPKQAMKSLSQQATQMAAKPKVAWEDFKIMLEQAPAGMAAVAKEMGMSVDELTAKIQDPKTVVAVDEFLAAIDKVGNSPAFSNMAQDYKTVGQAMDGLKETASNKLAPAFQVLEGKGIKAIEGIIGKLEGIDSEKLATKVSGWIEKAQPYWESFKEILGTVGKAVKRVTGFLADHGDTISKILPHIFALAVAFKILKVINAVAPGIGAFSKALIGLASGGLSGLAGKLFGISGGMTATGTASKASNKSVLAMAKATMMLGAGVLFVAGGLALLAFSAIQLANAGGLAIGVMVGMTAAVAGLLIGGMAAMKAFSQTPARAKAGAVALLALGAAVILVAAGLSLLAFASISLANAGTPAIACMAGMVAAIALLAVGAAALGPALTAGAIGFVAFGAAILMVSVGALLSATALTMVANVLPIVCAYGLQGATAIAALGGSLLILSVGALTAGAGLVVLGAGLVVLGAGAVVAGAGMVVFGAGVVVAAAGTLAMVASLTAVNSKMKSIGKNAKTVEKSMKSMRKSMDVVNTGLDALGTKAKSAMKALTSSFDSTATKAIASGKKLGEGYSQGIQSGCNKAIVVANTTSVGIITSFNSAQSGAYASGVYIGAGLANGMRSQIPVVNAVATQLAAAAEKAIRAKAKIHSPSKVSGKLGYYYAIGFINNIKKEIAEARRVAAELVSIPEVNSPQLAFAGGGELNSNYAYSRNEDINVTVVSEIDGRQVAKSTARYTRDEINSINTKDRRKRGTR